MPIGAVAGAVIGTRLLHVLPQRTLAILFIAVLVASALRLFLAADADGRGDLSPASVVALLAIGVVTGILAGLLGVGGGIVMVPAMILLFGIPPVIAKGTSAAVIIPAALMGTWRNRANDNTDLRAAAVIGIAGIVTAAIGGTRRRPDERRPCPTCCSPRCSLDRRRPAGVAALRRNAGGHRGEVNLAQYLIALGAVIIGAIAQGSVGFGFGMLAAPVLALVDEELVPGAVLLLGLTVAAAIAWQERGALDWLGIKWALVGRVLRHARRCLRRQPGSTHDAMSIVLGLLVLVAVGLSL